MPRTIKFGVDVEYRYAHGLRAAGFHTTGFERNNNLVIACHTGLQGRKGIARQVSPVALPLIIPSWVGVGQQGD